MSRDGLNLVFLRQYAVCVHINLDDTDAVAQHVFHLFQNRVHHFTRLTPGGEEVHQYKLIACLLRHKKKVSIAFRFLSGSI